MVRLVVEDCGDDVGDGVGVFGEEVERAEVGGWFLAFLLTVLKRSSLLVCLRFRRCGG